MSGFALAAPADVLAALSHARRVELSAYTLGTNGAVLRELEAAGDRGAQVAVTLESFADRPATNPLRQRAEHVARDLRSHGVAVRLGLPGADAHLKAAVIDGTAFLDDRNWAATAQTLVATTDPDDVAAIEAAIAGRGVSRGPLALEKSAALDLEAAAIRGGSGDVVAIASESFGSSVVSAALRARAAAGAHVRLLVDAAFATAPNAAYERSVLHSLAARGVEVRLAHASEKLCIAGDRGWVGSANATYSYGPMTDWGLAVDAGETLTALGADFERSWTKARPLT